MSVSSESADSQHRVTERKRKRESKREKEYLFPWHRDLLLLSLSLPISVNKLLNGAHPWANITAAWNTKWEQLFQIGGSQGRKRRPGGLHARGTTGPAVTRCQEGERQQSSLSLAHHPPP